MKAPEKFLDGQEADPKDLGPVDGAWAFVPNQELRIAASQGRPGLQAFDVQLREALRYSGDGVVIFSVPLLKWTGTNGWPGAGFGVAVMQDDAGIYVQPQDVAPDSSTRIAEA